LQVRTAGYSAACLLCCSGNCCIQNGYWSPVTLLILLALQLATFLAVNAWSLLDICCMCSSSKLLRSAWLHLLKQRSPDWLLTAIADAATAKKHSHQAKAIALVRWLLEECVPEAALAQHPSVPAGLLSIPRIPLRLAEQLCNHGVRVPYDQIVAAARRRVAGKAASSTAADYLQHWLLTGQ
jgi:hypothetical protein